MSREMRFGEPMTCKKCGHGDAGPPGNNCRNCGATPEEREGAARPESGYEPVPEEKHKELPGPTMKRGSSREPEDRISRRGAAQAINSAWASISGRYTHLSTEDKFIPVAVEAFSNEVVPPVDWEHISVMGTRVAQQISYELSEFDELKYSAIIGFMVGWTTLNKIQAEYPLRMVEKFSDDDLEMIDEAIGALVDERFQGNQGQRGQAFKRLAGKVRQIRHEYDPGLAENERRMKNSSIEAGDPPLNFTMADRVRIGTDEFELQSFDRSAHCIESFWYKRVKE